jgi:flagellar biosynthetic protein FlhB
MITGVLANVLQTGPVFSYHPVKPDWDRVNPASGFKRVFTFRTLVMGLRAVLKFTLLGLMVYFALKDMLPQFFHISTLSPRGLTSALLDDFAALGLKIGVMLGFIALLDWIYTRYEFIKQMRMSHREMKDEHKHREGDPRIRARLRELRREMLKRSLSLRRTKDADVVITNPTHVAVALRYTHGQMTSPQVIAKGKGFMAAAMRKIAAKHQIPVVQNPSLARQLYKNLPIDFHVPTEMYAQVARIIVWVFARRDAQRNSTAQASRPSVTRLGNAWNP